MRKYMLIGLFVTSFLFFRVPVANAEITIQQPGSTVEGKSIGEWTADWWKWALSQSVPNDAFSDASGANSAVGQIGPVFFIAGTTGGSATRSFTVPGNKFLLVPLINFTIFDLGGLLSEEEMRKVAASFIDSVDSLFAKIDGIAVPASDLFSHRELSPLYSFVAAPDNPFALPSGSSGNAVSDGYWLMLNPLENGVHTIRFGGSNSAQQFTVDVIDTIIAISSNPGDQIATAITFFDDSITNETLTGVGATATSAAGKLNAMENMLKQAQSLIQSGFIADACLQLADAYKKTDGNPNPPDFVSGPAAALLASQIQSLMASLGCQ